MKNQKWDLWIIGDSFVESNIETPNWVDIVRDKFNGNNMFLNACPGRDIQTIMDTFYKNLFNISEDSLVLIFLPSLARLRYPKNKKYFNQFLETGVQKYFNSDVKEDFKELFLHHIDNENNTNFRVELDFPFNSLNYNEYTKSSVNYNYLNEINDNLNITNVDFAKLLNANDACLQNWNDILKSLTYFVKFNLIFFSWTDEFSSECVFTKSKITKQIGWHTNDDDWNETNGLSGKIYDEHFSKKMHKLFSELIIKNNPKYFN